MMESIIKDEWGASLEVSDEIYSADFFGRSTWWSPRRGVRFVHRHVPHRFVIMSQFIMDLDRVL